MNKPQQNTEHPLQQSNNRHRSSINQILNRNLEQLAKCDPNKGKVTPLQLNEPDEYENQPLTSLRSLVAITVEENKLNPIEREKLRLRMKEIVIKIGNAEKCGHTQALLSPRAKKQRSNGYCLVTPKQMKQNIAQKLQKLHKKYLPQIGELQSPVNRIQQKKQASTRDLIKKLMSGKQLNK